MTCIEIKEACGGLEKEVNGITSVVGQMVRGFVVESKQRYGANSDIKEENPMCLNIKASLLPCPLSSMPLENLDCLVLHPRQMPGNSGVQKMLLFAPNICVLLFLKKDSTAHRRAKD